MTFTEAQYIIIGTEDGWLEYSKERYKEAKEYIIKHIDLLNFDFV